jgi:hypothetical protein
MQASYVKEHDLAMTAASRLTVVILMLRYVALPSVIEWATAWVVSPSIPSPIESFPDDHTEPAAWPRENQANFKTGRPGVGAFRRKM